MYLRDIENIETVTVYKAPTFKSPVYKRNTFTFNLEDDEKPEIDWDLTEAFPRAVKWNTKLL
jgi:hypothetical protein